MLQVALAVALEQQAGWPVVKVAEAAAADRAAAEEEEDRAAVVGQHRTSRTVPLLPLRPLVCSSCGGDGPPGCHSQQQQKEKAPTSLKEPQPCGSQPAGWPRRTAFVSPQPTTTTTTHLVLMHLQRPLLHPCVVHCSWSVAGWVEAAAGPRFPHHHRHRRHPQGTAARHFHDDDEVVGDMAAADAVVARRRQRQQQRPLPH